ncbi:MAG: hypothetical protein JNM31_14285 [Flavobacteriales bacterium]|nr:hypothetical protein [Flavobacteriales bacterium]
MNIAELLRTLTVLVQSIQSNGLAQSITKATQAITRVAQPTPAGQPVANRSALVTRVEQAKQELIPKFEAVTASVAGAEHVRPLQAVGADALFGERGRALMEEIFVEANQNPQSALAKLQKYTQDLAKLTQLHSTLTGFPPALGEVAMEPVVGNVIDVLFKGEAEISTLEELAKAAAKWDHVLIAFAMLVKENDRAVRVERVARGSLLLQLGTIAAVAFAFAKAADKALDVLKKYLEIRKLALEIRRMENPDLTKPAKEIEAASKLRARTEAWAIAEELVRDYGWTEADRRGDVLAAVKMATEYILKFMNKGGELTVRLLDAPPGDRAIEISIREKKQSIASTTATIERLAGGRQPLELGEGEDSGEPDTPTNPTSTESSDEQNGGGSPETPERTQA